MNDRISITVQDAEKL